MSTQDLHWIEVIAALLLIGSFAVYFSQRLQTVLLSVTGKHVLLAMSLFLMAVFASHEIRAAADRYARDWTKTLLPAERGSPEETRALQIQEKLLNSTQEIRMKTQYQEIRGRAVHHLEVMIFFFANYYRAIAMMMILGGIAAIALFFIANKGWSNADGYVINVFIVATALTAYFGAFPSVFKQQDNISDNKRLYLQYVALGNEISSYAATGANYLPNEKANANDFIHHVDDQLEAINDIAIGLDSSKVPTYKGVFSETQNRQEPNHDVRQNKNGNGRGDGRNKNKKDANNP
jgi:hypothetical protein